MTKSGRGGSRVVLLTGAVLDPSGIVVTTIGER